MVYYPSQADVAGGIALMGIFHNGKRIMCSRGAVSPVLSIFLLFFLSACATQRYQGPVSGLSANSQIIETVALGKVVDRLDLGAYSGKKIFLDVVTLTERFTERSPEETFIQSWIAEKLVEQGVRVVSSEADADLRLTARARAFGVDRVRRDLPLIYYAEVVRGLADFHFALYDLKEARLVTTFDRVGKASLRESFWFYMIGPFRTLK
ncbi:hypothetical protein [Candidatus Manganitrophus noduliformans]|uniref:Uncharacterized protein n=1 Tax=Candidatus Manganitrophus noduliformans TaxID=2606439 RepID=A0A7X6DTT0_9BACT|nr:hypothetical protein [Candidatus Manganitrophus noduliformans]NKE72903.1 hypothetical protein [Candidatus Manganitrophus noduliformans]